MEIFLTPHFKREAKRLSASLRPQVEKAVEVFLANPKDPSLRTHKLTGKLSGFLAFSVSFSHRIIFTFDGPDRVVFHSIGDHSIYD